MYKPIRTVAFPVIVLAALTACGGGGGGGGGVREVPFASFPAPDQGVVMTGISQTASGTITVFGGGGIQVDTASLGPVDSSSSTATLTFNGSGDLSAMSFSTPESSVSYTASEIDCSSGLLCAASNATSVAVAANPTAFGWSYQSFGVWLDLNATEFRAGAMSAGAVTPGNAVPTSGPATFSGFSSGFYANNNGVPHFLAADMTAIVDFGTPRSVTFNTSNTLIGNLNVPGAAPVPASGLNLIGSFTFAPGSSQFSGPIHTFDTSVDGLAGNGSGFFYGPNAEEMGGIYGLVGNDGRPSRMIGAFGGRKLP